MKGCDLMDLYILDEDFQMVYVLDTYESLVWVDKYAEPGTFELSTVVTDELLETLKPDRYISSGFSNHLMIIEDIAISSDPDEGNKLKIVGRSLESILDRRIVWVQTDFNNVNLNTAIAKLLNDAIIAPQIPERKIPNFAEYVPSEDSYISTRAVWHQYTGDNLLEVIESICAEFNIGFQIILNENNEFVFSLYRGDDHSYAQSDNPWVIFSSDYDNIISSNFINKNSIAKNVILVGGEGTGTARKFKTVGLSRGLNRRETFTNASDIQKGSLNVAKYTALLESRGLATLGDINRRVEFDSQCNMNESFTYGEDFFMGDIVQIINEYGVEASARITEFTWSCTTSGIETYPTFSIIENSIFTGKNKLATTLENLKALNTAGEWCGNIWVNNNVVVTVNTDNKDRVIGISFSGKNSSSANIFFNLGPIALDDKDEANNIVLSGCPNGSTTTYRLSQYDKTANADKAYNYTGDTVITVLDKTHVQQVRLTFFRNKNFVDVTVYPMVRSVSESSEFEPYDPELH